MEKVTRNKERNEKQIKNITDNMDKIKKFFRERNARKWKKIYWS